MSIDERKVKILKAIIENYIETGEPVGSRTIAKNYNLGISPATIRNEMSDLEDMGYLEQIHSSSGRRPSNKGYRLYVDKFMNIPKISPQEELKMKRNLSNMDMFEIDSMIKNVTEILSDMTKLTCIAKAPSFNKSYLKHIQLTFVDNTNILVTIMTDTGIIKNVLVKAKFNIPQNDFLKLNNFLNDKLKYKCVEDLNADDIIKYKNEFEGHEKLLENVINTLINILKELDVSEYYFNGTTNIFNYQEYNDVVNAKKFLDMIHDKNKIRDLLNFGNSDKNIIIKIGPENPVTEAEECSIISTVYRLNERPLGIIGIIGPTRIHYSKVVSTLSRFSKIFDEYIKNNLE